MHEVGTHHTERNRSILSIVNTIIVNSAYMLRTLCLMRSVFDEDFNSVEDL